MSQKMCCMNVDKCGVGVMIQKFEQMRNCLWNTDFSQTIQFIVCLEEHRFGDMGIRTKFGRHRHSLAYSSSDSELRMKCGLRFGYIFHNIIYNGHGMILCKQKLNIVITASHN